MARPSKYETKIKYMFDEIIEWREQGLSLEDVSIKLEISIARLFAYQAKYPEFAEVLKHSKKRLVNKLKRSLWREAMGFEYDEITLEESYLGIKKKVVKKYARSQAPLLIYALCNLDPNNFRRLDKEIIGELVDTIKNQFSDERIKKAFDILNQDAIEASKKENDPI